ncbi:MAG: hypothetical protein A3K19_18920 [Lentisphaerae bacterium RIFOXYB12_FULL_65_16]|nr:MAG: hypothetical protein A3K18_23130 [Lentisphaerae bacterium RIFOXYA12_64_32]OGV86850.1 MAG: hypothetical protein A3K19_18920 [Lentisphaerae bacterium RIFOXYB12_FULL_65_16]
MTGKLILAPGESLWIWGRDRLIVMECPSLQVDSAAVDNGAIRVTTRGPGPFVFSGPWEKVVLNGAETAVTSDQVLKTLDLGETRLNTIVFR